MQLKSYESRPNVLTLPSSVFIGDDLKLSTDSFYTLTNRSLFLLMKCKLFQVKGRHNHGSKDGGQSLRAKPLNKGVDGTAGWWYTFC